MDPHLEHAQPAVPVVLPQRLVPLHVLVAAEDVVDEHVETAAFALDGVEELRHGRGILVVDDESCTRPAGGPSSPRSPLWSPAYPARIGPTPGCCGPSHRRTGRLGPTRSRSLDLRRVWRPLPEQRAERCSLPRSTQAVKHRGGTALPSMRHLSSLATWSSARTAGRGARATSRSAPTAVPNCPSRQHPASSAGPSPSSSATSPALPLSASRTIRRRSGRCWPATSSG